jgi:hypothetical protein
VTGRGVEVQMAGDAVAGVAIVEGEWVRLRLGQGELAWWTMEGEKAMLMRRCELGESRREGRGGDTVLSWKLTVELVAGMA